LEQLSYRYPNAPGPVLQDLNLEIRSGEIVGLIGPTGAGKTTLCLALNGIVPQFYGGDFYGSAVVAGLDTVDTATAALAHHVALVFEDPEMQLTATTVEGEVAFALENVALPVPEIRERVRDALAAVHLEGFGRKHPAQLSGGQKQRLAIAAALALRPQLIVLDEPTSQLDPLGAAEVFMILRQLNEEHGVTILVTSHATEELAEVAHRVVVLSDGRIVAEGSPADILQETSLLRQHRIRPPDITQSFEALFRRCPTARPPRLPTTLAQAATIFAPLQRHFQTALADERPILSAKREIAIAAENLHHTYADGTMALRGVDLTIHHGEYVAIVGQNGGGKSTLVKHFLHLLEPTKGRVLVQGESVTNLEVSALARRIGYVGQNPDHQIFCDSVADEVSFALNLLKVPRAEITERVDEALRAMGLTDLADRHPLSLGRGDRSRVVMAAVLALQPKFSSSTNLRPAGR
jgi:energy-coupling factor transport system ATP-binding protein